MPAALSRRVEGVRLYAPNLRSLSLRSPGDYFLTTDTPNVMRWLADRMRAAGVELRLMQSFTDAHRVRGGRSEEHTSELQSLMRISYAVFCLKKKTIIDTINNTTHTNNNITKRNQQQ